MLIILRSHKVLSLSERCICIGKKAIFGFGTIHWGSWKVSPLDKSELLYRAGPLWSWTPSSDSPSIAPSCFSTNETKLVLPSLQPMLHPCACCSHCLKWTPHLTSNSTWPTLQSCLIYHSDLSSDTSATMEANQPSRFAWNCNTPTRKIPSVLGQVGHPLTHPSLTELLCLSSNFPTHFYF